MKTYQFPYQIKNQVGIIKTLKVSYYVYEKSELREHVDIADKPFSRNIFYGDSDIIFWLLNFDFELYFKIEEAMKNHYQTIKNESHDTTY